MGKISLILLKSGELSSTGAPLGESRPSPVAATPSQSLSSKNQTRSPEKRDFRLEARCLTGSAEVEKFGVAVTSSHDPVVD